MFAAIDSKMYPTGENGVGNFNVLELDFFIKIVEFRPTTILHNTATSAEITADNRAASASCSFLSQELHFNTKNNR